jgi:hypothetical protein
MSLTGGVVTVARGDGGIGMAISVPAEAEPSIFDRLNPYEPPGRCARCAWVSARSDHTPRCCCAFSARADRAESQAAPLGLSRTPTTPSH